MKVKTIVRYAVLAAAACGFPFGMLAYGLIRVLPTFEHDDDSWLAEHVQPAMCCFAAGVTLILGAAILVAIRML